MRLIAAFAARRREVFFLTRADWGWGRVVGASFVELVQYFSVRKSCRDLECFLRLQLECFLGPPSLLATPLRLLPGFQIKNIKRRGVDGGFKIWMKFLCGVATGDSLIAVATVYSKNARHPTHLAAHLATRPTESDPGYF